MIEKLNSYLTKMAKYGGSDLHIKTGSSIRCRLNGEMRVLDKEVLDKQSAISLAKNLLEERYEDFEKNKSADFTYRFDENARYRVNIFHQIDGISAVFRVIPINIPKLESLSLPTSIKNFTELKRGLVLVTGPTGSGKSTTLASIINEINLTQKKHIITIEDPVEFVYKDMQSLVNQRAIGVDAIDFSSALRAALREDPDIILVGEMRDMQTIETALHAAETGHLVLSTLHTIDAKETVSRIVGMFPGNEQNKIKLALASTLQGVVSQRLVKTTDGKRCAAVEVLVKNARIEELIKDGRDSEITEALEEGKDIYKTQSFDQALFDLVENGKIDVQVALQNATKPADLKMKIENIASNSHESLEESKISLKD